MEIIVKSRQTKSTDVLDMAFDLGLDRPKIVTVEEWDGSPAFLLTFGPAAYRKTAILRPWMTKEQVTEKLVEANGLEVEKRLIKSVGPHLPITDKPDPAEVAKVAGILKSSPKRRAAKSQK